MSRVCELTGKKAMVGNNVSHALNRTKRKFDANLMTKRFYIPEEDKWITLKVSTSALKNINKKYSIDEIITSNRNRCYKLIPMDYYKLLKEDFSKAGLLTYPYGI